MSFQQLNAKRLKKSKDEDKVNENKVSVDQGITVISTKQDTSNEKPASSWTTVSEPVVSNNTIVSGKPISLSLNVSNNQSNKPFKFIFKKK